MIQLSPDTKEYLQKNKILVGLLLLWLSRQMFMMQANAPGVYINKFVLVQLFAEFSMILYVFSKGSRSFFSLLKLPVCFFFLLYFLGMLSFFWGAMPYMGTYFAFQNIAFLAIVYYMADQVKDIFAMERYFLFSMLFILGVFFFQRAVLWHGYFHAIDESTISGVLFIYCLAEYDAKLKPQENLKLLKTGIVTGAIFLLLTTSSGALVSTAAACCVLALFAKNAMFKCAAFLFSSTLIISYYIGAVDWIISLLFPGKSMASIQTAHGRTYIWNQIFEKAAERPWFGWGYASVERIIDLYCIDSHNTFVGVLGCLGYVGCTLFVLGVLTFFLYTLSKINLPGFRGVLCAGVCIFVNSNTSNLIATKETTAALVFHMILILAVFYWEKRIRTNTHPLAGSYRNNL